MTVVTSCNDVPVAAASASVARSSRPQSVSIMSAPGGRVDREADAAVNTRLRQQQRSMPSAGKLMAAAVRKYAAMRALKLKKLLLQRHAADARRGAHSCEGLRPVLTVRKKRATRARLEPPREPDPDWPGIQAVNHKA